MGASAKKTYSVQDQYRRPKIQLTPDNRALFAQVATDKVKSLEEDCIGQHYMFPCPVQGCGRMAVVSQRDNGAIYASCPGCRCDYDEQFDKPIAPREWEVGE